MITNNLAKRFYLCLVQNNVDKVRNKCFFQLRIIEN